MATQRSAIEWTNSTWSPVTGCDQVSPGCARCYAKTFTERFPAHFPDGFRVTLRPDRLEIPLRWKRGRRIFVNSMSDLFHPSVPDSFIEQVFSVMSEAKQHQFQVLTKRAARMAKWTRSYYDCDHGGSLSMRCGYCEPWPNVWLGVSVENRRFVDRIYQLRETSAAVRFVSFEPLLGPVTIRTHRVNRLKLNLRGIDWAIIGGESGAGARPMELEWVEDLVASCRAQGVRVFVKQLGTALARQLGHRGKGGKLEQLPEHLRIREYPEVPACA